MNLNELKKQLELENKQESLETADVIANEIKTDKLKTSMAKASFIDKIQSEFGNDFMNNPNGAKKINNSWWDRTKKNIIKFFKTF